MANGAGKPAARIKDPTVHGGAITAGEPTVVIGGSPAARVGDAHTCPKHGGGPISAGSTTVNIAYKPAARVGDPATCSGPPDAIASGCQSVSIGG
jgi:uncharacterized Zn-binding protein involved in type VI secretion